MTGTYHVIESPLGPMLLELEDGRVTGLWFEGQKNAPEVTVPSGDPSPLSLAVSDWLARYFRGGVPDPALLPLDPPGTDFQKAVWAVMARIPRGRTVSYAALSRALRDRGVMASPRAVGRAVGWNPVSVLLPCHRVVGADGGLTGYAGGTERKAYLLRLEGALGRPPMEYEEFNACIGETERFHGSERS